MLEIRKKEGEEVEIIQPEPKELYGVGLRFVSVNANTFEIQWHVTVESRFIWDKDVLNKVKDGENKREIVLSGNNFIDNEDLKGKILSVCLNLLDDMGIDYNKESGCDFKLEANKGMGLVTLSYTTSNGTDAQIQFTGFQSKRFDNVISDMVEYVVNNVMPSNFDKFYYESRETWRERRT